MTALLARPQALAAVLGALDANPVAVLLGPRQCGKTTLARQVAEQRPAEVFDLENPVDRQRLSAPLTVVERLRGLVVIDEIQRRPDLFEIVRVLVDRPDNEAAFLLLGSASPAVVSGASESLAGRAGFVDLSGFSLAEAGPDAQDRLWLRGGCPRSFLAANDAASMAWRQDFIRTFLERDIPQLGIRVPAETIRRFWTMVAHYHGGVWNAARFARSLGTVETTARHYLDILAGAFMVRVLPPWFENVAKRQVKAPKLYLRDSGLLHALLQLGSPRELQSHPSVGVSWEGFAIEQVVGLLGTRDCYFWATHGGAELDLLVMLHGQRHGFEIKYMDAPRRTRSMLVARDDLGLARLWIVYPGSTAYSLDETTEVVPIAALPALAAQLRSAPSPKA